jgi:hypothetical protein
MKKYLFAIVAMFAIACGSAVDNSGSSVVIVGLSADDPLDQCIGDTMSVTAEVTSARGNAVLHYTWYGIQGSPSGTVTITDFSHALITQGMISTSEGSGQIMLDVVDNETGDWNSITLDYNDRLCVNWPIEEPEMPENP